MSFRAHLPILTALLASGCVVAATLDGERDSADLPDDTAGDDTANDTGDTDTGPVDEGNGLWISVLWTHSGDDLDLHLLAPDGVLETETDCYYANCIDLGGGTLDWGVEGDPSDDPRMDLDDIPGTGPENITFPSPSVGTYRIAVKDYPGSVYSQPNPFTLTVRYDGVVVGTFQREAITEDAYVRVALVTIPGGLTLPWEPDDAPAPP